MIQHLMIELPSDAGLRSSQIHARQRLRSYYLEHRTIAELPWLALEDALRMQEIGARSASFLQAMIAVELCVKRTLFQPMVSALLQNSIPAEVVVLTGHESGAASIAELIVQTLNEAVGIDLRNFRRVQGTRELWNEIKSLHKTRGRVVDHAQSVSSSEAEMAIAVAKSMLEEVFPALVLAAGLHLHLRRRICGDRYCKPRTR